MLQRQRIPNLKVDEHFWEGRLESIRHHEEHLARNGMAVVKFWLNVSKEEQKQRFLSRLDKPEKNWKFNAEDVESAFERARNVTGTRVISKPSLTEYPSYDGGDPIRVIVSALTDPDGFVIELNQLLTDPLE